MSLLTCMVVLLVTYMKIILSVALFEQIEEFILYSNTTLIQSMIPTCDRLPKKPKSSMPTIVRKNVYETRQKNVKSHDFATN